MRILLLTLLMSGCVSIPTANNRANTAYMNGFMRGREGYTFKMMEMEMENTLLKQQYHELEDKYEALLGSEYRHVYSERYK